MPFLLGLGHLLLLYVKRLSFALKPPLSSLYVLLPLGSGSLRMTVRLPNRFTAVIDMERAMVHHAFEAVFLNLGSLPIEARPLQRRQGVAQPRGCPVHQSLARLGL